MNPLARLVSTAFLFALLCQSLFAQAGANSLLRGVVTDPSGAVIPGASITLSAGEFVKVTTSDAEGKFSISNVPSGKYTIRVSSVGFNLFEQQNFDIPGGRQITVNAQLNLANEKQQITVTDSIALDLDPASNVGQLVLKGDDLQALSDNPDDLSAELQALAGPAAGPNGGQIFIDGFSGGKLPPKASIREVRVNSNPFSSEYDRIGFGRIEVFTKPGTDKFRGQAFYSASNNVLNSRSAFAPTKPDYSQNAFGGNLSGPLGKRASFFLDADSRRIDDNNVVNARILDDNFNVVPFQANYANPTRRWDISPRIDFALSEKHTLTTRYSYGRNTSDAGNIGNLTLDSRAVNVEGYDHTVQATHTWLASGTTVLENRFQFFGRKNTQLGNSTTPSITVLDAFSGGGATLSNNFSDDKRYEYSNLVSTTWKGHLIKFGGRLRAVQLDNQDTSGYNGSFIFTSLDTYRITLQGEQAGLPIGQIIANGGGAQQFTLNSGIPLVGINQVDAGLFVQDDWRVKPNISLSLGLRFETQSNVPNKLNFAPRFGLAWGLGKPGPSGRPKTVLRIGGGLFYDRFDESSVLQTRRLNGIVQQQYIVSSPVFYPNFPSPTQLSQFQRSSTTRIIDSSLDIPYLVQTSVGLERQISNTITLSVSYNHTSGFNQLRSRNLNTPLPGTFNPQNPASSVYPFGAAAGNIYSWESTGRFRQNQLIISPSLRMPQGITLFGFYSLAKQNGDTDGAQSFPHNTYDLSTEWGRTAQDVRHRGIMGGFYRAKYGITISPFMIFSSGRPFNIVTGRDNFGDNQFIHRPGIATDASIPGLVSYNGLLLDPNPKPGQEILARNFGEGPSQFNLNLRLSKTFSFGGEQGTAGGPGGPSEGMRAGMMAGGGRGGPGGGGGGGRGGPGGMFGGGGSGKYNLTIGVQAANILNKTNLGQPIGTLTSPLFGISNTVARGFGGPGGGGGDSFNRRIELSVRFSF
ncbi:MAG: hypothetical protein OHK0021_01520 [Bryobacter sp.]